MLGSYLGRDLRAAIEELIASLGGKASVAILDVETGDKLLVNSAISFPMASVVKLPIAVELMLQVAENRLDLMDMVTIPNPQELTLNPKACSGALCLIQSPTTVSLLELATLMLVVSDNVAADILLEKVGMNSINARMRYLGLEKTTVNTMLYDTELLADSQINPTTADDMLVLLEHLYNRSIPHSGLITDLLERQQFRTRLPTLLPPQVRVWNKTGTITPNTGNCVVNDVGIVVTQKHDFIACFLSMNQDNLARAGLTAGLIAYLAYEFLNHPGRMKSDNIDFQYLFRRVFDGSS